MYWRMPSTTTMQAVKTNAFKIVSILKSTAFIAKGIRRYGKKFQNLEKDLKKLLYEQLLFQSNEASDWDKVLFGRGTFNGLALFLEQIQKAHEEHIGNSLPKEKFDKYKVVGEL